jgi:prepilin-type N-terminal cleavage/methylation domain-containing protein
MPNRKRRGFTLIELVTVVAIVGVAAAMVLWGYAKVKERGLLRGAALEMRGIFVAARQHAATTGNRTVVMIFPNEVTDFRGAVGKLILYEDGDADFFGGGGPLTFDAYDPRVEEAGPRSQVVETMELPFTVTFGPVDGWGVGTTAVAPYAGIPLDRPCVFCTGANGRGAVVFDPLGAVTFYDRDGPPLPLPGAALTLTARDTNEVKTLLIAGNGSMRSIFAAR